MQGYQIPLTKPQTNLKLTTVHVKQMLASKAGGSQIKYGFNICNIYSISFSLHQTSTKPRNPLNKYYNKPPNPEEILNDPQ